MRAGMQDPSKPAPRFAWQLSLEDLMTIQQDTTSPASVLAKYVGIALILLVLIWGASKLVLQPANDLLHRADNAFGRVFNLAPQTMIKADSVVLEKSSIAELAVVA